MSNWAFVAIAYTLVWGSIAIYALLLARRVAQTRAVTRALEESLHDDPSAGESEAGVCDTPHAP